MIETITGIIFAVIGIVVLGLLIWLAFSVRSNTKDGGEGAVETIFRVGRILWGSELRTTILAAMADGKIDAREGTLILSNVLRLAKPIASPAGYAKIEGWIGDPEKVIIVLDTLMTVFNGLIAQSDNATEALAKEGQTAASVPPAPLERTPVGGTVNMKAPTDAAGHKVNLFPDVE